MAIYVSLLALLLSGLAVLLSIRATRSFASYFRTVNEKLVKSVMEEGGDASVEAVLRTCERLARVTGHGRMSAEFAFQYAMKLHGKKL
jgi:hypothetical protein